MKTNIIPVKLVNPMVSTKFPLPKSTNDHLNAFCQEYSLVFSLQKEIPSTPENSSSKSFILVLTFLWTLEKLSVTTATEIVCTFEDVYFIQIQLIKNRFQLPVRFFAFSLMRSCVSGPSKTVFS